MPHIIVGNIIIISAFEDNKHHNFVNLQLNLKYQFFITLSIKKTKIILRNVLFWQVRYVGKKSEFCL